MPLAMIYAAQHTALVQMGHEVNFPCVISARKELNAKWISAMIKQAETAKVSGVLDLD